MRANNERNFGSNKKKKYNPGVFYTAAGLERLILNVQQTNGTFFLPVRTF